MTVTYLRFSNFGGGAVNGMLLIGKNALGIGTTTSCARVAVYLDDHQSGTIVRGNVIIGFWNGVFMHFGRSNNISQNIFIDSGLSIALAACAAEDRGCNKPLNDTADTMMSSLREAMQWPQWKTRWMPAYPALTNVSWNPGATINNSVEGNIVISCNGRGFPPGGGQCDNILQRTPPPSSVNMKDVRLTV